MRTPRATRGFDVGAEIERLTRASTGIGGVVSSSGGARKRGGGGGDVGAHDPGALSRYDGEALAEIEAEAGDAGPSKDRSSSTATAGSSRASASCLS